MDDETLINTLVKSKITSNEIKIKVAEAKKREVATMRLVRSVLKFKTWDTFSMSLKFVHVGFSVYVDKQTCLCPYN